MRAAVLGGTFNPPHWGHLCLAEEVRVAYGYDLIIFLPAHLPAHKDVAEDVSPLQRLKMLEKAIAGLPRFTVDPCEMDRGGISYTVETIPHLIRKYGIEGKPAIVLGDDLLDGFGRWREAERLAGMADLIVAHRKHAERRPFAFPHRYIDNLLIPISSTDIRRRIRAGEAVRFLVPEVVWKYIKENELYR